MLGAKNVAVRLPNVGDGVDGASDGLDQVAVGDVTVLETAAGRARHADEATVGGGVTVGGLIFDVGAGEELEAAVAVERVPAAVENAG